MTGVIRYELDPSERALLVDLKSLAGMSTVDGVIVRPSGRPYTYTSLAGQLNISVKSLTAGLTKLCELGLVIEDRDGIHIANWEHDQSEYSRQKKYRQGSAAAAIPSFEEKQNQYARQKYGHLVHR